ncbi:alpha/beta fold hydrolase [Marinospirillum insulare]|uniref:Transporter n=1 Tax=Marinospirillum insulare TaxID=217169 RepID=A0ABQ5ZXU3_9GAMM|nr:alpha/beta fold hydrolase [Marinospirillum insulare]GLR64989.1 transporter [Marinospirillum insulare]
MNNTLVLLAGWGLGTQPLNALAISLETELQSVFSNFKVLLHPLPLSSGKECSEIIQQLDTELPQNCWLAGWSLGGMLATALAAKRQQQTGAGLITLASNACFVANVTWLNAMPASTFTEFYKLCEQDIRLGLKRFTLLCSQGGIQHQARSCAVALQAMISTASTNPLELLAGLDLLASLDNRATITHYAGPQLHLLAENDTLVPLEVINELKALNPCAVVEQLGKSHASPIIEPVLIAQRMAAFIASQQYV